MKEYTAINKKTEQQYGPIDEAAKKAMEENPATAGKYKFVETQSSKTKPAKPVGDKVGN